MHGVGRQTQCDAALAQSQNSQSPNPRPGPSPASGVAHGFSPPSGQLWKYFQIFSPHPSICPTLRLSLTGISPRHDPPPRSKFARFRYIVRHLGDTDPSPAGPTEGSGDTTQSSGDTNQSAGDINQGFGDTAQSSGACSESRGDSTPCPVDKASNSKHSQPIPRQNPTPAPGKVTRFSLALVHSDHSLVPPNHSLVPPIHWDVRTNA